MVSSLCARDSLHRTAMYQKQHIDVWVIFPPIELQFDFFFTVRPSDHMINRT